ncbi:hypothetical protein Micbo1qcDRAFT_233273 [Microdochium bolleyi]|uniref:Fungal-type protein kinase domain-containing protein n=1 Tax=Microdochium bolleyi TaxID=196109 RepID=A0A136J4L9_9PEZI|nr:hypothetical protein Micbo1qcDRAFT_233273 [Microdochium bolleyi]
MPIGDSKIKGSKSGEDKPSGRSDVAFTRIDRDTAFAVVEYKKRGAIPTSEKALSFLVPRERAAIIPEKSLFTGNWKKLMQQASLYATLHRTKYIALFNWDTLVLIRFHELGRKPGDEKYKVGERCKIDIVKDSAKMRLALLAFLHTAYMEEENKDKQDAPAALEGPDALISPVQRVNLNP